MNMSFKSFMLKGWTLTDDAIKLGNKTIKLTDITYVRDYGVPANAMQNGVFQIFIGSKFHQLAYPYEQRFDAAKAIKYISENYGSKGIQAQQEKDRRTKISNQAKDGTWEFPSEKFYRLCQENKVTALNSEFGRSKAIKLAEQVIAEAAPHVELSNFSEYIKPNNLEKYLAEGKAISDKIDEQIILEKKMPRDANPTEQEKTFLQRASALAQLLGADKRSEMLDNLYKEISDAIEQKMQGEAALKQLALVYANQQKKESSWAVMGGIAEGIAGPAAGIMAASQTIESNRRVQEHNAAMRSVAMDMMRGSYNVGLEKSELEEEKKRIKQALNDVKTKVVLTKPTAEEIWNNIDVGKATVKKEASGVLSVSVPISLKKRFELEVPEDVCMVVDGTIKAEVWFEENLVGEVLFPLPMCGLPNHTAKAVLDGMCGRSVEFDGDYIVKFAEKQNLWIMES